jgi:hypothetical protein
MRGGILVILVIAGCGRLGFDEQRGGPIDAATDAASDATPADSPIDTLAGDALVFTCTNAPGSYVFAVGGSRYRIAGTDSWLNSEDDCESDGAGMHLATIDSAAEREALLPLAGGNRVWLGVSDRVTEGSFLLATGGVAMFLPWQAGAPTLNGEDCVSWDPQAGTFKDESCALANDRICECDGASADPAAY